MNYLKIKRNKKGYLLNLKDWNKEIAEFIAKEEKIKMNKKHWEITLFLRKFYLDFNILPSLRIIINEISKKKSFKKIDSVSLFYLFPKGIFIQAVKIAGLPEGNKCL